MQTYYDTHEHKQKTSDMIVNSKSNNDIKMLSIELMYNSNVNLMCKANVNCHVYWKLYMLAFKC